MTSALYGNGQRVNYKYDSLDRPVIKYYNNDNPNNAGYHTVYNANGLVGLHKDVVNTQRTRYTYDLAQRLVRVRRNVGVLEDNGAFLAELAYTYENNTNRLSAYTLELLLGSGTSKVKTSFTYGNKNGSQMTDAVYEVRQNGGLHKTYTYDGLGRKTQTMMSMGGANKPIRYTYVGVKDNRTTTMLESLDNFGEKLSYTYDANGNIETIRKNGVLQETYHYDGLNQLVRADSAAQNKSFTYAYDAGGNILSVKEYAYTTGALGTAVKTVNYGYTDGTWKDLLTSYAGQTITYDGIGNPLSYRDGLSMTWRNGRELASLTKNGVTASYLYDESGLRTKKTVGGVVTNYHVINGVLYGEYTGSHRLLYMFDEAGTRYSFLYNGSTYYYVFNGQGDVIGITDGYGNMLARYTYDAWGKPLTITDGAGTDVSGNASHIANVNPIRYRGYYYDKESGLYYLQSRYYDPVVGRFINADAILGANGDMSSYNMFAYCGNNPISRYDAFGTSWVHNGIPYVYDGSIADFHRAESGLPPLAYVVAVNASNSKSNTKAKDIPDVGLPGSHVKTPDGKKERWYGPDGRPTKDRHHTDHGNPKQHPYVPHDHDWGFDEKGNWTPGDGYPSPEPKECEPIEIGKKFGGPYGSASGKNKAYGGGYGTEAGAGIIIFWDSFAWGLVY